MTSRLNVGLRIPAVHPTNLDAIRAFVLHAEDLGFHSIWAGDHVFYDTDVLHPLHLLTWVSAITTRVRLGTAVMLGAYRHPVLLANAAATLDYLSQGRLTLGLSTGGTAQEYASLGVPMRQRVGRFVESVTIMRELWRTDDVTFSGRFFSIEHGSLHPKPLQQPGIPLYFGATSDVMRRRAAQHADGWIASSTSSIASFLSNIEPTRQFAAEFNRDPDTFGFAKLQSVSVHQDASEARALAERQWRRYYGPQFNVDAATVYGTPEECASQLSALLTSAAPELTLVLEPPTLGLAELDLLSHVVGRLQPESSARGGRR
jgi:probable F420-dependent oxidoreductase